MTASNLKNACHASLVNPSLSLIKSICYPEITSKFANAATNWGKDKESVALKTYMDYIKSRHCDVEVSTSGFVIHIDYPHLGASPDGLVSCSCCKGKGCLKLNVPTRLGIAVLPKQQLTRTFAWQMLMENSN